MAIRSHLSDTVPGIEYVPGLLALGGIAVAAKGIAAMAGINALIVAIACGVLLGNTLGTPAVVAPGIHLHKLLLETGIVLLGAELTFAQVVRAGPTIILLVTCTVAFGLVYLETLARVVFGLREKTGSLLAAGSSICGVSAAVAVAGTIDADEEQIAYAAATILLFDAVTIVVFPVVGDLLGMGGKAFGVWAGLSMFSTGPVAAAGFAHSAVAGQWATITKLVRNAFIGVAALAYSVWYARRRSDTGEFAATSRVGYLWAEFPKFLVGFLLVVAIANVGVLSGAQLDSIGRFSDWLFLLAFAGLGFDIRLAEMRATGVRPILVVLVHLVTVSAVMFTLVSVVF